MKAQNARRKTQVKNLNEGQAPNVKSRQAFNFVKRIWYCISSKSYRGDGISWATEARRLRSGPPATPESSSCLRWRAGQAMMTAIIFFLLASVFVVFGISTPVLSEVRRANLSEKSNQSFYAAESAIDDMTYRIQNAMNAPSSSTLSLNDADVSVTVTDVSGGKKITSEADILNHFRKLETELKIGDGVAFHYGIQTGNGGFIMLPNAGVYGNVYSNGDITGSNGAFITASAIAGNSAALSANQVNNSPEPPASSIIFGQNNSNQDSAQSFVVTETGAINKIRLNLKKIGAPGNLTVRIAEDISGSPSTSSLTSAILSASLVTTNFGWVEVVFPTNPDLTPGNTYWIVLDGASSASKYYEWGANSDYANGSAKIGIYGGSFSATNPVLDGYFEVYLGGLFATISNVSVGQNGIGDAHAHNVNNSTVAGNLYCQSGSGNNKSCDSSKPDPSPQPFPISDANIADWKSIAEAGGVINGNYAPSGATVYLGPKKINGDLTVGVGQELILTGTTWVTGNIYVSNNGSVSLDPGYELAGGILLSDGYISLSNNVAFSGSGEPGSYLLLLTTSDCPQSAYCSGNYAIGVENNVETVVLNAQKGTINFSNNAGANAATAKTIRMENNATVTYLTGLADLSFSSGPSGGYEINYWREAE